MSKKYCELCIIQEIFVFTVNCEDIDLQIQTNPKYPNFTVLTKTQLRELYTKIDTAFYRCLQQLVEIFQTRRDALQKLNIVRIDDVINSDVVDIIKKHVLDSLCDNDEQIMVGRLCRCQ